MNRRAFLLVELLVALSLAVLVLGAVLPALVRRTRSARRDEAAQAARRTAQDAARAIADELRETPDAAILGDTAIEALRLVGTAVTCTPTGGAAAVLTTVAALPGVPAPHSAWRTAPRAGDSLLVWDGQAWAGTVITSATRGTTGCAGVRDAAAAAWRLLPAAELPAVAAEAPVRVLRRLRWVVYRSADVGWTIGVREQNGARWDAVQPAFGPTAAPAPDGAWTATLVDDTWRLVVRAGTQSSADSATIVVARRMVPGVAP